MKKFQTNKTKEIIIFDCFRYKTFSAVIIIMFNRYQTPLPCSGHRRLGDCLSSCHSVNSISHLFILIRLLPFMEF